MYLLNIAGVSINHVSEIWYPFWYTKWVCSACPVGNTVWLRENLGYASSVK